MQFGVIFQFASDKLYVTAISVISTFLADFKTILIFSILFKNLADLIEFGQFEVINLDEFLSDLYNSMQFWAISDICNLANFQTLGQLWRDSSGWFFIISENTLCMCDLVQIWVIHVDYFWDNFVSLSTVFGELE